MGKYSLKVLAFLVILLMGLSILSSVLPVQGYRGGGGSTTNYGGRGNQDDWGYSVILTKDIGLAMAGFTESYGAGGRDMWLIRTVLKTAPFRTAEGENRTVAFQGYAWNKTYGGSADEVAKQVIQTIDGGFALAGYTNSTGAGGFDMYLVKTDADGDVVWDSMFGGPYNDVANSLIQTIDGGYMLAGYTHLSESEQATWVVKTDSAGKMQWSKTYHGLGANSVNLGIDGSIVFAFDVPGAFGFLKIGPAGEVLTNEIYPAFWSSASAQSVVECRDGGYALAGWIYSSELDAKAGWVIKIDALGNRLWDTIIDNVRVYSLIEMSGGDYAMCGDYASVVIVDRFGIIQFNRPNDSLSDDLRAKVFTAAYSIIEASPLHFVLAGAQDSYGQIPHGFNADLMTFNLVVDSTPPTIKLFSPENGLTYPPDYVPLAFYADSSTVRLWYGIDDKGNFTISGNMTLSGLTEGTHKITVYGQDQSLNTGASQPAAFLSQTIYFNVDTDVVSPTMQPTPTQNPSAIETISTSNAESDPYFVGYLLIVVIVMAIVLVALGWYLRRDIPSSQNKETNNKQLIKDGA